MDILERFSMLQFSELAQALLSLPSVHCQYGYLRVFNAVQDEIVDEAHDHLGF